MVVRCCFLLVLLQVVGTVYSCQTPDGSDGECMPLSECPLLYSHFEDSLISERTSAILRKSLCGFHGKYPKVCCPPLPSPPPSHESRISGATSDLLPDPSTCGLHVAQKITNGEVTGLDEFPWMALLQFKLRDDFKTFECGGSLINKRYVLTAAHCILPALSGVRLGEYNLLTNPDCIVNFLGEDCAPPPLDFGIEETIVHEGFQLKNTGISHDIALIRLDRDVEYSDFIKPICLPLGPDEIHKSYLGKNLTVSGWGFTEKETKSDVKLKAHVPVQDLSECAKKYRTKKPNLSLDDSQICAGGVGGRDSCKADSGGPLMTFKFDKHRDPHVFVVGVVSFGPNPCGQENFPGIYTKVATHTEWILSKLRP